MTRNNINSNNNNESSNSFKTGNLYKNPYSFTNNEPSAF